VAAAQAMDPREPGYRAASGLAEAVHQFNDYVDDAFLTDPSDEFLVIETVLAQLVLAALANEGRAVDDASRDGAYGLACAPAAVAGPAPAPPAAPAPPVEPPPAVERPISVCVLEAGQPRYVPALLLPATGDTVVIRAGERVPLATAHPHVGYSGELPWVYSGEMVTVGQNHYAPFGEPFAVAPTDELVPAGTYRGVTLFKRRDAPTPPETLLLPTVPRCVVQPYRLQEDIRKGR
jgi:hypothetical protein